jgi:hypothetical protein
MIIIFFVWRLPALILITPVAGGPIGWCEKASLYAASSFEWATSASITASWNSRFSGDQNIELLVKVHQRAAELPKLVEIHGCIIHKSPGFSIGADFASQNQFLIPVQFFFDEKFLHVLQMLNTETGFHDRFTVSMTENGGIGPFTKDEGKCSGDNGFTRAGFSCDHLKAFRKINHDLFNVA